MSRITLTTERLTVRTLEPLDAERLAEFLVENRSFHQPFDVKRGSEYYTEAFWRERLLKGEEGFRFALFRKGAPGKVLGMINYAHPMRGGFHACYVGYMLAESAQGQGLMGEALGATNRYMFEREGFHRIMANYMPRNEKSGRVLEKLGFIIEGHAKDYLFINGRWEDHVMASLINRDWRPLDA